LLLSTHASSRCAARKDAMLDIQCYVAETRRQLDDALRVRYQVFAEELEYIEPARRFVPREVDPFDTLETTIHLVACVGGEPAGVVRLLSPNREVARSSGAFFGVDLESKFDLSSLAERGLRLAETMRYCVLSRYRRRAVAAALHAAAVDLSRSRGITHWLGCANTETDSIEDAHIIRAVAARRGVQHGYNRVEPRAPSAAPLPSRHAFYSALERRRADVDLAGLPFPRTLELYARRMAARFIGPPIYDATFRMCSMPLLIAVDEQLCRPARAPDPAAKRRGAAGP
jgi:L-ornithine Nalpha-acyltransferase